MTTSKHSAWKATFAASALIAGLALCMPCAGATTSVDQTRPANNDAKIEVSNISGAITITAWERAEMHVTGSLGDGVEELRIEGDPSRWQVEVVLPEHAHNVGDSHIELHVPRGAGLDVSGVSANINASGVNGSLELETVSGNIDAQGAPREIRVSTASGDIVLAVESPQVTAQNISGDIELSRASGFASVETVSGDLTISGATLNHLEASSVSGDINFAGGLAADGSYSFECHSGDIALRLPAGTAASFEVSTFSGRIQNDLGPEAQRTSRYAPGSELDFKTGSGGASVHAETFSGDVMLSAQ